PRSTCRRVAPTIDSATRMALSHSEEEATGDHPTRVTAGNAAMASLGSNSKHGPSRERAVTQACKTSLFVETARTLPAQDNTFGMTTELVFPDRGGPSTKTPCSGGANRGPELPFPR